MTAATKPRLYAHTQAIKTALTAAGLNVGDHVAPKSSSGAIVTPCVVLYMTPSAVPTGTLAEPDTDVLARFRLVSVERTPDGAEDLADLAHDAIDGATLTVDDRAIFRVKRTGLGGVVRDDEVTPPCFYCSTPYSLMSISSPEAP